MTANMSVGAVQNFT